jgi:hypothetical protein
MNSLLCVLVYVYLCIDLILSIEKHEHRELYLLKKRCNFLAKLILMLNYFILFNYFKNI